MTTAADDKHNRRDFLGWLVRGAALAGVAGLGAALVLERRPKDPAELGCVNAGRCGSCPALDGCRLRPDGAARSPTTARER